MRQGRGALIVGLALIVAFALVSAAWAQGRNNQPAGRQPRGQDLPPSGHQTEAVDLNEGKSPAELFKAGCAVCHQSAAGLAKGRRDSELAGFLRQHYTSGTQHAAALAGFLTSAGAGGRGAPAAAATPARLNPNAPIDRPPAPVGREEEGRKPQEAARPEREPREPPAKRKPPERPPVAARPAPAQPAAPPAPATEAAAHQADAPAAASAPPPAPVEEKPAAPEIPL